MVLNIQQRKNTWFMLRAAAEISHRPPLHIDVNFVLDS